MHEDIEIAARMLYENLKADIENASTRIEHIRLTTLAQEAANLLTEIEKLNGVIDSNGEEI
jgi:hypothetical protein